MPDSLMYCEDAYVLLETGKPEELLTPQQLQEKLASLLRDYPQEHPSELASKPTMAEKVNFLMDTSCDLALGEHYVQWYVVRLEK